MSKLKRIFWLVSLLFFLGGCGGYRQVNLSGDGGGNEFGFAEEVKTGDRVRLLLMDGDIVEGLVEQFGETGIVLRPLEGDGPLLAVPFSEVKTVERHVGGSGERLGVFVLGFLLIVGISTAVWVNNPDGMM